MENFCKCREKFIGLIINRKMLITSLFFPLEMSKSLISPDATDHKGVALVVVILAAVR